MISVVSSKEMQNIDRATIQQYGIAGTVLMERAGLSVVSVINELFPDQKVIVLCGRGNNGGDGLVIARELHNQGKRVTVYMASPPHLLKGDARTNYKSATKFGVKVSALNTFLSNRFQSDQLIVDALLGTGLNNNVRAPYVKVITKINKLSSPIIAVDIPSGISSDSGEVMGCAVKASVTVTFGLPKRGHLLYPGAAHSGRLFIENIGFPNNLLVSEKLNVHLFSNDDACRLLPQRTADSHKGTYGHVLLLAGSRGKTGAALMAAKACLKTGAGLVTIGLPDSIVNSFQKRVTEEMILPLADKGDGTVSVHALEMIETFLKKRGDILAIGPGLSVDREISQLVGELIARSRVPVVIDADGLNALAGKTYILKKALSPVVLTPHIGEMKRLSGEMLSPNVQKVDRIDTAVSFARKTKSYLVLKGAPSVSATPEGKAFINSSGNPGMATAGTGDVLTGMISAFLAQGVSPAHAAALGVYLHGCAGDIAAEKKGQRSLMATDLLNAIPAAFKSVER